MPIVKTAIDLTSREYLSSLKVSNLKSILKDLNRHSTVTGTKSLIIGRILSLTTDNDLTRSRETLPADVKDKLHTKVSDYKVPSLIHTAAEYKSSKAHLDNLKLLSKSIIEFYDPHLEDTKVTLRAAQSAVKSAQSLIDYHLEPIMDICSQLKRVISKYDIEKDRQEREIVEKFLAKARDVAASQGEFEKADELESQIENTSNELKPVFSQVDKGPTFFWDYEIIDPTRLKIEATVPDNQYIKSVVTRRGKKAESIIGKGSIRVFKNTRVK